MAVDDTSTSGLVPDTDTSGLCPFLSLSVFEMLEEFETTARAWTAVYYLRPRARRTVRSWVLVALAISLLVTPAGMWP